MLDGERKLVDALMELADESSNPQLKKAFSSHRDETEGQVKRIEQCFALLGEDSEETECAGIKGLIEERKAFIEEDPSDDLIDVFDVGAAIKTESYEINAYKSLIRMSREMKHTKVARLLEANLKEERAALKKNGRFQQQDKAQSNDAGI
jgi:ferritin-like metal-binding protein YciE